MRFARPALFLLPSILSCVSVAAQTPPRDPQAIVQLQRAITAMGGTVPADSTATGTIVITAGGATDNGTIRMVTRGLDQTVEQIDTSRGRRTAIYSRGLANEIEGSTTRPLQLELAVTSQCPSFPLPALAGALSSPQSALQYVGLESLDGVQVHHLRIWSSFSQPRLQHLWEFSVRDVWIDAVSGLPRKLSHERREARGPAPRIPVSLFYSDYRSVGGVQYPFLIRKSVNGTPWATITVQQVQFNTGLTDRDFPVQ